MGHLAIGCKGERPMKNLSANLRNPNPQRKQGMLWKGAVSGYRPFYGMRIGKGNRTESG